MIYLLATLRILILSAVTFFLLVVFMFYFFQHKLIFFPYSNLSLTPTNYGLSHENITISIDDENYINGWFFEGDNNKPVILFFNGNGGNKSHHIERAVFFKNLGFSSMLFDYRGYGNSKGKISEKNLYHDGNLCLNFLKSVKNFDHSNIILWGWSLGGAVAARTAQNQNIKALILESSFTNIKEVGSHHYPFFPVKTMAKFKFETDNYIKNVTSPILIFHSSDDEIIPFYMGKKLFSLIENNSQNSFHVINGSHNESFYISQNIIESALKDFILKH
ncbi:MAG: alpha/beta hydrolase [Candidatus Muiribacteriota bacterium]